LGDDGFAPGVDDEDGPDSEVVDGVAGIPQRASWIKVVVASLNRGPNRPAGLRWGLT